MLSKREALRKGAGGIAPNWPCWDTPKTPYLRARNPGRVRKEYPGAGPQKRRKSARRSLKRVRKESESQVLVSFSDSFETPGHFWGPVPGYSFRTLISVSSGVPGPKGPGDPAWGGADRKHGDPWASDKVRGRSWRTLTAIYQAASGVSLHGGASFKVAKAHSAAWKKGPENRKNEVKSRPPSVPAPEALYELCWTRRCSKRTRLGNKKCARIFFAMPFWKHAQGPEHPSKIPGTSQAAPLPGTLETQGRQTFERGKQPCHTP